MKKNFKEAIKLRRSHYGINKEEIISDKDIKELIDYAVKHTPSAFNSQTARVVLLLGNHHTKLWEITREALRKVVPEENFAPTDEKIDSFNSGYGTVLFFEDHDIVEDFQESFPLYKDNFPLWSLESSGMLQSNIWTSLKLEGYGASLQHYNELIEEEVKKEWNIPKGWKMRSQMPFGKPTSEPGEKEFAPLEDRVKLYK
ncbi:MAG: nitroreductase family protein [Clostridium sp.]|nr:nitroreductase family protein [Clostridium sp.]